MAKIRVIVFLLFGVGIAMIALFAPARFWNHGVEETPSTAGVPELSLPTSGDASANEPQNAQLQLVVKQRTAEEIISATVTEERPLETSQLTGAYPQSLLQKQESQRQTAETALPMESSEMVSVPAPVASPSTSQSATTSHEFEQMRLPEPMVVSGTQKHEASRISQGNSSDLRPNGRSISHKRTHVIMNGDSLQTIAGRYLRDPNRGDEIFNCNRDVLPSPDMLPIGVKIVIPD